MHSIGWSIEADQLIYNLVYLTKWNISLTFMISFCSAYLATSYYHGKLELQEMTKKLKFYWFLHNNVAPFACFITIFYWKFLYKGEELSVNNILVHGTNVIGPLLDLFVISNPYHLSHCIYPMFCAVLYMIFTIIFQFSGGINPDGENFIYSVTDWRGKPQKTIKMAIMSIVAIGVLYFICCGLQFLREKIYESIKKCKESSDIETGINMK